MLRNLFKYVAAQLQTIPAALAPEDNPALVKLGLSADPQRVEMRPQFLVPFDEKFDLPNISDVISRDRQIEDLLSILALDSNGNAMLLGFPGTGKTALAKVIARSFSDGTLDPLFITGMADTQVEVLYLDAATLGGKDGGRAADKIREMETYLKRYPDTIVFVDEAHLLGKTDPIDPSPIAELMKPLLNESFSHFIFATTVEEHKKYLANIPAMDRRWTIVPIPEATPALSKLILRQHRENLLKGEKYRNLPFALAIPDMIVNLCVELAVRFVNPDKAGYNPSRSIKLLEQALSRLVTRNAMLNMKFNMIFTNLLKMFNEYLRALSQKDEASVAECQNFLLDNITRYLKEKSEALLEGAAELVEEQVYEALSILTGLPYESFEKLDKKFLDTLAAEMKKRIIGQDVVMDAVSARIRRSRLGLGDPTKPIFAGLFAGPTGVGKTETAKALARLVFNREDAIVVINGGEFQQEHELTKLKGAPPSYVGYGDRTQLDEVLEKNGRCVILIDEFEKMHKVIQEFLLAALDEGEVKNSKGQKVNFRESIIILTSNLGSDKLVKIPMDSAEDDFRELLAFRRETLEMIERLAEGFEARSYELQNEKRFDEAELLTQKGTALRRFLAENGSALQRGKFPEEPVDVSSNGHKTNIEELDKLLAERKLEDDEIREAFEQGGTKKYDHALKVHRRRIVENLRKKNVELGGLLEKYIEEQNDMADDDKLAIENGEYLLVFLTGGDHDKELKPVREWLQKAEKRDRELQTKRQEAGKSEKERAKIEAENQRIIEEVFRAAGYKPEFLARVRALGGIFAFNNMSRAMTQAIIRIKAKKFISEQRRIFQCDIEIAEEVYDYILSKVKDLDKMGGRGIENKFSELIKDRLGAEFLATGQRSNTKVAIVLEDGKIKINIIPLGEPDLREIAPQQGEAGALLEHFHRQAVDLNDVYSAYNVSLAEVRELLAGERIVDRGAPLKFDPNQSMAISGIMKCLDSFKKTPMSQALRFLAQGLLDMGADEEYAKAAQAVAQGLVLMASKGLFDYILKIDFKNNQDSFDTLKARSEGNDANGAIGKIISNVMAAGAAKNSKFTWRAGEDGLHFQVSVPCKLTEREIKLFQLYLEKAVDDEQAAQRIFEEAKAQGLYPNLNLLRNFAKLRQLAGSSAEIGFFIAEGKVNFWLSSPFVKAKPEKATVEKAAAGKKQKTSASAFDASKKDDGAYIAEFISANAEDWDQLSPEQLLANPAAQAVSEGLFDYFSEDVMLAEADEVESYVMPSLGEIYKTSPALNESLSFKVLLLDVLDRLEGPDGNPISIPIMQRLRVQIALHEFNSRISEIAATVSPEGINVNLAFEAINQLRERDAIEFEGMTRKEFDDVLQDTSLALDIVNHTYLCRQLGNKKADVKVKKGEKGEVQFTVKIKQYAGEFAITPTPASLAKEKQALAKEVDAIVALLDRLPNNDVLAAVDPAKVEAFVERVNKSPFAEWAIGQVLNTPAIVDGPLHVFQEAIKASSDYKADDSGASGNALGFSGSVGAVKTFLLKLNQNLAAGSEAEMPYSGDELLGELAALEKTAHQQLVNLLKEQILALESSAAGKKKKYLKGLFGKLKDNSIQRRKEIANFNANNATDFLESILKVPFFNLVSGEQLQFWVAAIVGALENLELGTLKKILEKAKTDTAFSQKILPLILPNLAQTSKAYVDDFAKTLQAIDLLRQFTEENKERAALKQTLVDWLFTEINNAIGFIESPEDGALVSELLSGLKDSWIVKTGAAQYLGAMAALIAKLDAEMSRLRDEIIDVVPALRPITRNPNSLNIFRRPKSGANPIPGAVDTVEFLGQNRDAFDRVNAILAGEISGEKNKFKVLKQGGSHSVKSLYELIKDERGFFSGGNGVTMVLAVKTKKKKNFLYVSVTGRDRGSAWEFETELK